MECESGEMVFIFIASNVIVLLDTMYNMCTKMKWKCQNTAILW